MEPDTREVALVWEKTWRHKLTLTLWCEWSQPFQGPLCWWQVTPILLRYEHATYGDYSEITAVVFGVGVMLTYWWGEGLA